MSPNNWLNFLNLDFEAAQALQSVQPYDQQQQQQHQYSRMHNNTNTNATGTPSAAGVNSNNMLFDFAGLNGSPLSDDLKAQLEAWTTVSFGGEDAVSASRNGDFTNSNAPPPTPSDPAQLFGNSLLAGTEDIKKDPSPYAKRPFGNFGSNYQALERGFNAFTPNNSTSRDDLSSTLNNATAGSTAQSTAANTPAAPAASVGSNDSWQHQQQTTLPVFDFTTAFPTDLAAFQQSVGQQQQQQVQSQPQSPAFKSSSDSSAAPAAKRQRTSGSSSSDSNSSKSPATSNTSTSTSAAVATSKTGTSTTTHENGEEIERDENGIIVKRQPLLTKAAILAKQLEDLQKKQGRTPQEEALRVAELNRIAAEDDKRRRNTAASARFRVKKKAREAALEDTVNELKGKINGLEQDLVKTRNENAFLRDLVIRKIGLGDLGASGTGPIAPVQSSLDSHVTGVGTL